MKITEVRVKLMPRRSDRLRAFCSITIDDDFVVHDLRVIEGRKGLFVAMPSRKLTDACPSCGVRNDLRSRFCGDCGAKLVRRARGKDMSHDDLHVDVAHPVNTPCRETLQATVLAAYTEAVGAQEESLRETAAPAPEADGITSLAPDVAPPEPPPEDRPRRRSSAEPSAPVGGFADGIL